MKIIFMGTPAFSCPTLQSLIEDSNIEVVAVYSKEPSISGRGKKVNNSQIHKLALKNNIKVITPKTLRDPQIIQEFIDLKADACVVVAYGLILPKEIIDGTKFGCINLHPSLLPLWRGAAPIQRTIMNGDTKTATCIMRMDEGLDSGDIIKQNIFDIDQNIIYNELADKFSNDGANLIIESLKELENGTANFIKQDHDKATYAKKISKEEAQIDWSKSASQVNQKIRGLSGNIGAYFMHQDERIKILKAKVIEDKSQNKNPGKILNNKLQISCSKGTLEPLILQKAGKQAMELEEFLKGFKDN
jgi:methionyl-tRNA formyltransferase